MRLIKRQTLLSENIVLFCRYLRSNGFTTSPDHELDALKAMTLHNFNSKSSLKLILKLTMAKSRNQFLSFDKHFDKFWEELNLAVDAKEREVGQKETSISQKPKPSLDALKKWLHGNKENEDNNTSFYSNQKELMTRDFSTFSDDELWAIKKVIKKIAKTILNKKSRRFTSTAQHKRLDVRKVMRNTIRRGGEVVDIYFKEKKPSTLNLVILSDVSKSMVLYSRFLIQFLYAFQSDYKRIETFVFSSAITRVTDMLKDQRYEASLTALINNMTHWGDGTRIGDCLSEFEMQFGSTLINKETLLVIVSDGLDTDKLDVLDLAMQRLYKATGKIVWLNPLAGASNYKPEVGGMKTALPYIDILAPVHNLESLKQLPGYLTSKRRRKYSKVVMN